MYAWSDADSLTFNGTMGNPAHTPPYMANTRSEVFFMTMPTRSPGANPSLRSAPPTARISDRTSSKVHRLPPSTRARPFGNRSGRQSSTLPKVLAYTVALLALTADRMGSQIEKAPSSRCSNQTAETQPRKVTGGNEIAIRIGFVRGVVADCPGGDRVNVIQPVPFRVGELADRVHDVAQEQSALAGIGDDEDRRTRCVSRRRTGNKPRSEFDLGIEDLEPARQRTNLADGAGDGVGAVHEMSPLGGMYPVGGVGERHPAVLGRPADVIPMEVGEDHVGDIVRMHSEGGHRVEKTTAGDVLLRHLSHTRIDQDGSGTGANEVPPEVQLKTTLVINGMFGAVPLRVPRVGDDIRELLASGSVGDRGDVN